MKKILLMIILFLSFLNAKTIMAEYKVSFGIFGRIGVAKAIFKINKDKTYRILISAKATGFAKVLSGGRVESYESSGKIVKGVLIPDIFKGTTKTDTKISQKIYYFLHKKKVIDMLKIRKRNGKTIKSEEKLKYYTKNDILTLFFNIRHYLNDFKFKGKKVLYAVGANKKDGRVDLIVPVGKELEKLKKELNRKDGNFMIVFINQKIFASKRGELFLDINDNGIATKAVLKDVILFGDIRGKLKKLEITND